MSEIRKNLGGVTAYAYAKSKGYTGTEEEFAQLMANYATISETATEAAERATTKASEASTSATNAATSASAASASATAAAGSASAAATSETNAAASASSASTSAESASESADDAAESAAAAQAVKDSIPADYTALSGEVTDLKNAISLENEYGTNLTPLPITSLTLYGITVAKVNGNTYRISGTATATVNIEIGTFQQVNGKSYHFRNNSSNEYTSTVYIYLYGVRGTDWIKTDYNWTATETKNITYRLYVDNGQTVDFTIQPLYYTNESNIDLDNYAKISRELFDQIITYNPHYNMQFGSIGLSNNPPTYANSTTRIRTMEKVTIPMSKNDVISVDTTGIVFYFGWKNRSGQWKNSGAWVTKYTLPEDGDAVIVARYSTETTIASVDDISSHIIITRHNSIYGEYGSSIIKNKRRNFFVRTINHRGFARYAPENTLIAFKLSSYIGFDAVETDVRFTSDGVPVLLHDTSINRTARNADGTDISGTINIADITYEQALTYDFGVYRGTQFAGTRIPTFEEFIILCKKLSLKPYVEIKDGTGTHISAMYNIVKKCAMLKNTTWIAYNYTDLQAMTAMYPSARIGLLGNMTSTTINILNSLKTDDNDVFMDADIANLTSQNILDLIDAGIPLEVFTINSITTANNLDPYVSGITADDYDLGYEIYSLNMDDVFGTRTVVIQ